MTRKFIVGDIHGCWDLFQDMLVEIDFDKTQDMMYSVGDLVDRGPDSMKCLKLIKEPWFRAVRGNHEDFMIGSVLRGERTQLWIMNGGGWHLDEDPEELKELVLLADELPLSITLTHENIGICHAEPPTRDWNNAINTNDYHREKMIWGRDRVRGGDIITENIGRTFHGHTVTDDIVVKGNAFFIDTGAVFTGQLTCVEV